jgi:hypothetical protein
LIKQKLGGRDDGAQTRIISDGEIVLSLTGESANHECNLTKFPGKKLRSCRAATYLGQGDIQINSNQDILSLQGDSLGKSLDVQFFQSRRRSMEETSGWGKGFLDSRLKEEHCVVYYKGD